MDSSSLLDETTGWIVKASSITFDDCLSLMDLPKTLTGLSRDAGARILNARLNVRDIVVYWFCPSSISNFVFVIGSR